MRIRKQKHRYAYTHIENRKVKKHKVKKHKVIRFTVEDVNRFWEDDMFYYLIGTYISAETLIKENDYKASYQKLTDILEGLKSDECIIPEDDRMKNIHRVEDCIALVQTEYKEKFNKELCNMTDELTKNFNDAMQAAVFDPNFKCENEVDMSNVKPIDKTDKEHFENVNEELIQKIIEFDNWIAERQRKTKPAIIIDTKGNYVDSMYGATYFDYLQAKKHGRIKKYN